MSGFARRRPSSLPTRGLTLLEMLVTLVIVALVAAILGQALGQLARIERLLESGQLRSAAAALRAEWVRDALTALTPDQNGTKPLRASERELDGLSSSSPQWPSSGEARLRLRLSTDSRAEQTQLELLPPDGGDGAPVVLLRWPGREGRFRYLDGQGQWHGQWPVADAVDAAGLSADSTLGPPRLPRAIALETGSSGLGTLLAQPALSSLFLPSRKTLEAL